MSTTPGASKRSTPTARRPLRGLRRYVRRWVEPLGGMVVAVVAAVGVYAGWEAGLSDAPIHIRRFPALVAAVCTGILTYGAAMAGGYSLRRKRQERPVLAWSARGQRQRNRSLMLDRVRALWITGVLERSLETITWMELGLWRRPDAVGPRPGLVTYGPKEQSRALPPGTSIVAVFEQMGQALLVLGAPGSGKTTLLLDLARQLLDRAEREAAHPMPVVFNLSSWAVRRPPLAQWLTDELAETYDVPRRLGQAWVDAEQILPLLDGLDEVAAEHRDDCVEAINVFRQEHGLVPMAVCSRTAEHAALTAQLRLVGAVEVQPLTRAQVDAYLEQVGESLAGVRAALREDPMLWELLQSPLLLSIMTLAYQGKSAVVLPVTGTLEQRRERLFALYVETMLERRAHDPRYPKHQTVHWLAWLARSLQRHNQTEFYLERLQRDWLPTRAQQHMLTIGSGGVIGLFTGLFVGLFVGLGGYLLAGLFVGLFAGVLAGLFYALGERLGATRVAAHLEEWSWAAVRHRLRPTVLVGLVAGLVDGLYVILLNSLDHGLGYELLFFGLSVGLATGLGVGLFAGLLNGLFIEQAEPAPDERMSRSVRNALLFGLFAGLLSGAANGLLNGLASGMVVGLLAGLSYGVKVGLPFGLFYWLGQRCGAIQSVAHRRWSWLTVLRRLLPIGLLAGVFFGLLFGMMAASVAGLLGKGLVVGLVYTLVYGLLFGLLAGLLTTPLIAPSIIPDEGTRRPARAAVLMGLSVGLFVWMVIRPVAVDLNELGVGLVVGLFAGLFYRLGERSKAIQLAEQLRWSWSAVRGALGSMSRVGLGMGLVIGLLTELSRLSAGDVSRWVVNLLWWPLSGLVVGLIFGLAKGLSAHELGAPRSVPNEGTRRAARNALVAGLLAGLGVGLSFGFLPFLIGSELVNALLSGLTFGLIVTFIVGLYFGGTACLQHYLLRGLLVRYHVAPPRYVRFLDYAVDCMFLRRVGGGYIFVHRLLLEHFATLELGGE